MEEKQFKELLRRLDLLTNLIAATSGTNLTTKERILLMSRVGMTPKEIAEILGTTSNAVSVRLSEMKKGA